LHNTTGTVHGGAIASLAELAADFAIDTVTDAGRATKLLDHNVHHVHRVKRARLIAEARVVDRTDHRVLVDVSVRTGDGTPIARSRLTALVL
jgi:uncharacterized protein (TIGR00369 family)